MPTYAPSILIFLLVINGWTILFFWLDKERARSGAWRIPEGKLLGLALAGGSPGAYLARHLFRHKTRKQPFSTRLFTIVVLQASALVGLAVFFA